MSATVRLNDGHEGAALTFPRQSFDNAEQPVDTMLAWPSLVSHPHEAPPLRSGVKYVLTIWCELPVVVYGATCREAEVVAPAPGSGYVYQKVTKFALACSDVTERVRRQSVMWEQLCR